MLDAMKTYSMKQSEVQNRWILIDAEGLVLGRLASFIAVRLKGKHKATYTPSMNMGDHVVVINADKVHLTGKKRENKTFYWHTGYPGGIKKRTARETLEGQAPQRLLQKAVERMLTRSPLGRAQMKHLHVYAGSHHSHRGQNPMVVDFASFNPKNAKRGL